MRTKLFTLLLALAASVGTLFAESGTCGDNLTWDLTDGVLTISGTGDMTNYQEFFTLPPWSDDTSQITQIFINSSVTSIGDWAFAGCSNLTSIEIPNGITNIGVRAFDYCIGLMEINVATGNNNYISLNGVLFHKDLTTLVLYPGGKQGAYSIPISVTSIGEAAFSYCSGLTSIEIPNSVTSIGDYAFAYCPLTSVVIPNSITRIGTSVFLHCNNLTNIEIPNTVTSIGETAFYDCSALSSITIPNTVTSIGEGAFQECSSLTSVNIPNSVTSIGDRAFDNCFGLKSIKIPNSITSIGKETFMSCSGLTSIEIPNSVTSIGEMAFYYCSSLTSVLIGNSVTSIGGWAFSDCSALTSVTCEAITPPACEKNVFSNVDKSIPLYVPTESIEAYQAAYGWEDFTNIQPIKCLLASGTCGAQGDNLTWELSCDGVLTISGTGAMADYNGGVANSCAPWYASREFIKNIVIDNGVTSIGNSAFYQGSNITSVTMGYSVKSIGSLAFFYCSNLKEVNLSNGITTIRSNAFQSCTALTSLVIPNSVTSIEREVFTGCSLLSNIVLSDNLTTIESNTFYSCVSLTSVTVPNRVTSIQLHAFGGCSGLTSVSLPNSLTSIGGWAFSGCNITSLTIGQNLSTIGQEPFSGCTALSRIIVDSANPIFDSRNNCNAIIETATNTLIVGCKNTIIPNTVTAIGDAAFLGCRSMTNIVIPNNVAQIGSYAFGYCTALTSLVLPDSVIVEDGICFQCSGIENFKFPAGNTKIEDYSCYVCSSLESVEIPNCVTSIGDYVFNSCTNLKNITCHAETPPTISSDIFYNVNKSTCIVYVPKKSVELYQAADYWKEFMNIRAIGSDDFDPDHPQNPGNYQLTLTALPEEGGTVTGEGLFEEGSEVSFSAEPNNGYAFVQWNDGVTEAVRTITLTRDTLFTAEFVRLTLDTVIVKDYQDIGMLPVGENTNLIIKTTGGLEVSKPTVAKSILLEINNSSAAEVTHLENLKVSAASVVIRLEPEAEQAVASKWYALAVPFPVEVASGIRPNGATKPAVAGKDFVLDRYNEQLRATTQKGWERVPANGVLEPGVLYMMAVNGTANEWRFDKIESALLVEKPTTPVSFHQSEIGIHHAGWNGVANTLYGAANAVLPEVQYATKYHNDLGVYEVLPMFDLQLTTGTPFFVQAVADDEIQFNDLRLGYYIDSESGANTLAPRRREARKSDEYAMPYIVAFHAADGTYTDKAYISLASEKADTYTIGRDLQKMQGAGHAVPQVWMEAYSTRLAAHETAVEESATIIPLGLYAPQTGEYELGVTMPQTDYTVTLLYQGTPVADLTFGAQTVELSKGEHAEYALHISRPNSTPTGCEQTGSASQLGGKLLINGHLYIQRDGTYYTATGAVVK